MNIARVVRAAPLAHLRWDGRPGAPSVVLLHGTGAATHSWRGLLPQLAARWSLDPAAVRARA